MANIDNFEPITTLKMDVIDVKLIKDLSKHWIVEIRTESDIILIDLYSKKHPPHAPLYHCVIMITHFNKKEHYAEILNFRKIFP